MVTSSKGVFIDKLLVIVTKYCSHKKDIRDYSTENFDRTSKGVLYLPNHC